MSELEEKANGLSTFTKKKYYEFVEHLKNYIEDEETRNKFLLEFMKIIDFNPNSPQRTKEQAALKLQRDKEARALAKEKKELEKQEKRLKQNRFKKPIED